MNLDDEDLEILRGAGVKVKDAETGKPAKTEKEKAKEIFVADAMSRSILSAVRDLVGALGAFAKREPTVVTVKAPEVTVKPEINVPKPVKSWDVEQVGPKKWRITPSD